MRHLDPGQHQKARVVGQQPQVRLACAAIPSDPGVARRARPRRRAEQRAAHWPSRAVAHQIPDGLAHRVAVARVVGAAHQAVEQPQVFRAGLDDAHGERPQLAQRAADGCGRMSHKRRVPVSEPVGRLSAALRQSDVAGPFQLKQQRAHRHILDEALCVAPVPPAAKLFAEPGSAPVAMGSHEPLNQPDILGAQFPALYHHDACHGSHGTA